MEAPSVLMEVHPGGYDSDVQIILSCKQVRYRLFFVMESSRTRGHSRKIRKNSCKLALEVLL